MLIGFGTGRNCRVESTAVRCFVRGWARCPLASLPLTRIALASGTALALEWLHWRQRQSGYRERECPYTARAGRPTRGMRSRWPRRCSVRRHPRPNGQATGAEIRDEWDRTSREIGKALGTSLKCEPNLKNSVAIDFRGETDAGYSFVDRGTTLACRCPKEARRQLANVRP